MTHVVLVVVFKSELVVSVYDVIIVADHSRDVLEPVGVKGAVRWWGAWWVALALDTQH